MYVTSSVPRQLATAIALAVATCAVAPAAGAADHHLGEVATPARQIHRPTVIRQAGSYVVARDFVSAGAGAAIAIRASDVTLDLGARTLTGPGAKAGIGVQVVGATNVRVFGGSLRSFGVGVQVTGSKNVRVAGVQIDGDDLGGTPPDVEVGVMLVNSRGVVVEENLVTDTFLGVFVRGEQSGGNRIAGNTLEGGQQGELGICYNPAADATAGGPDGDLVHLNHIADFNRGIALSADSTANVVRDNSIAVRAAAIEEATSGSNLIEDNAVTDLP